MDTLLSRHRNMVVLISVLFVQLIGLAYQVRRPDSEVPLIREWVMLVVSPPQRLVSSALHGVTGVWSNYIDLRGARRDTLSLEEQLNQARIRNHELQEQVEEMHRVQALESFRETSSSTLLVARIIGGGASEQSRVIFLNRGREDGVKRNMAVITADGIVGKVNGVFTGLSQVLLITDEQSGVGALLEKSRIHGVLRGQNSDECQLRYVLNDEKIAPGEQLFTSGEDRVFPKGFPIGSVTAVEAGSDFKHITVKPAVRLNRLEDVFIVLRGRELALPGPAVPSAAQSASSAEALVPDAAAQAADKPAPDKSGDAASERPGIPHGVRPETEADRLMGQVKQKPMPPDLQRGRATPADPAATPGTSPAAKKPPTNPQQ